MLKSVSFFFCYLLMVLYANAQSTGFSRADTLRGSNGAGRNFWNVLHYDITVNPDIPNKTITGKNNMRIEIAATGMLQLDLQEPMILDKAVTNGQDIPFRREGNVYWLDMGKVIPRGFRFPATLTLGLSFHGTPREAKRAPWDGGWVWSKDRAQNPWISVACQGLGASVWYPCKDFQGDEPDQGATVRIVVPDSLTGISNGRLLSLTDTLQNKKLFTWNVVNPVNNYCIVPYIGKYIHWHEIYKGLKGDLDMDYWALEEDSSKAVKQFEDAPRMMKAFEYWMGPYPFYEDGYKLVQTSFLGMEHQSGIAYGNKFRNGYMGRDLSGTGWGMKWDFIIVHESGHEWFANNITTEDIADMWVHEGFTNYAEVLFTEYYYGKNAGAEYVRGIRQNIKNDEPITGRYGVNDEGSSDMYYKAANMIHLIRRLINDDAKFRDMLIAMNSKYYHHVVTAAEIEAFISNYSKLKLGPVFNQYLHTTDIPVFEYKFSGGKLKYHFTNVVKGFSLKLPITIGKNVKMLTVSEKWKSIIASDSAIAADADYLVNVRKID
jgi:aminopeptidase N